MRWFARRLVFYVFALWVALTINFLLPRLMPGSPIDGILQHLTPAQLAANPGIVKTYEALVGGGQQLDLAGLRHVPEPHRAPRLRHLHLALPAPVSQVVGQTLPYSIFLVGVAFFLSFVIGTAIGMFAAWRRGGFVDSVFVPTFMALSAFPAFFTALLGALLPRPQAALVPDPARL